MNIFQTIFIDVVLLSFPILVYLIYLSTNENINSKSKKIYLELAMFTSFFILYRFGLDNPKLIPFLVLNSLVILSFI
ncbi:MAG: hypothetical protein Q4E75_03840, partial [bacterium]|nr:hypothetical protein [bacterium]